MGHGRVTYGPLIGRPNLNGIADTIGQRYVGRISDAERMSLINYVIGWRVNIEMIQLPYRKIAPSHP